MERVSFLYFQKKKNQFVFPMCVEQLFWVTLYDGHFIQIFSISTHKNFMNEVLLLSPLIDKKIEHT